MAIVIGDSQSEPLIGTPFNDAIFGNGGDDTLQGLDGDDFLTGGPGDDAIEGGGGEDSLFGRGGDDTLIGNTGDDQVLGNAGDDLLIWKNGDGSDAMNGGGGDDTVQVNGADADGDIFEVVGIGGNASFSRLNLGLFTLTIDAVETLEVNGLGGNDMFTVGDLSATDLTRVNFDGGGGVDVLDASASSTEIVAFGGTGSDLLSGSTVADTLNGNGGADTLIGNFGNDRMRGGGGDDLLIWNNGDGSDRMIGSGGEDTVQVNGADGLGDDFSLDAGLSDVQFQRNNLGLFTLNISVEAIEVNGQGGDDLLTVGDLSTTDLTDVRFNGGDGNDTFDASANTRSVSARGQQGDDLLKGGSDIDRLDGNAGSDTMIGNFGNDRMQGGGGDDRFIWNNGDGSDQMFGEGGHDTVEVNGADGLGDDFEVVAGGFDAQFSRLNLGLFTLDLDADETLEVNGLGGDDIFTVGDLSGTDLASVVFSGGEGNDTFDASAATTSVTADGGDGDDTLAGGSADDTLIGGSGDDGLTGNGGADVFVYTDAAEGVDAITDFSVGEDILRLDGALTGFTPGDEADFIAIDDDGVDTTVEVDADGTGGAFSFVDLAVLEGVTGVDLATLLGDFEII